MTEETAASAEASAPVDAPAAETAAPETGPSIRDTIEAAFAKVGAKDAGEAPKADAKPADGAEAEKPAGPTRDANGRFVKADAAPEKEAPAKAEAEPKAEAEQKPEAKAEAKEDEKAAPRVEAPSRFSPDAKAAWAETPPAVQSEVTRALNELQRGVEGYQERMAPLKPYLDMAEKSGTTLDKAIDRYVQMETMLRDDPLRGFENIAQNMGLTMQQIAEAYTGQSADQQRAADQQTIAALTKRLQGLEQQLSQVGNVAQTTHQTQREQQVAAQIEAFKANAPRFDELQEPTAEFISRGYSLEQAYDMADRLNPVATSNPAPAPAPAPAAAQTRTPEPAAQTRNTSHLSVRGTPGPGQDPVTRPAPKSSRDAVARAFEQVGLNG